MTPPLISRPASLLFSTPLLLALGCGGGGPELVPVSGQVFVDDKPAEGALVTFSPESPLPNDKRFEGGFPRGYVNAEGRFALTTVTDGDGAPPGNYIVLVNWSGRPKNSDGEETGTSPDVFQGRYTSPESPRCGRTWNREISNCRASISSPQDPDREVALQPLP